MHHVYSQLKADIESRRLSRENEPATDADSSAGFARLRSSDLQQLLVKHSSGELAFFCDLGVCLYAVSDLRQNFVLLVW